MKNFFEKLTVNSLVQIALVAGITILALNGVDGWGWLVFCLVITL